MKRTYTDARKTAIARDRYHVFNQRKTIHIDFAATVPEDVQQRADDLFPRLIPHLGKYKLDQKRQEWRAIFMALERAASLEEGCIAFPRNERHPEYRSTRLQLIDAATAEELILDVKSPRGSPKMSRYIPYEIKPFERNCFVELRDRESEEPLPFDKTHPVAADMQRRLERVNNVNANWKITIRPYDWLNREFEERRRIVPVHYAVFTNDFEHHGRIYTGSNGHQRYGGEARRTILFNDWPSVELDYSGMHPRLLYHLDGIPFTSDPYKLWGAKTTQSMRLLAKKIFSAAINAESRKIAIAACNGAMCSVTHEGYPKSGKDAQSAFNLRTAYKEVGMKFSAIYDLAIEHHAQIGKHFGKDEGIKLMRVDSRIALKVLNYFASQGIPCLGVHDSFIVPNEYRHQLRRCMIKFYMEETGFEPVIR